MLKLNTRFFLALATWMLLGVSLTGQEPEKILRNIFDDALTTHYAWNNLAWLCKNTKGRIDGSPQAQKAVEYTFKALKEAGADSVWLQEVTVPHWVRGKELCRIRSAKLGSADLAVSALGMSGGTTSKGISGNIIEVHDFEELRKLGRPKVEGKIIFFNRPVDEKLISTMAGYGGAVNQRTLGASEASKLGAAGVIVRSATQAHDNFPHTGMTRFEENVNRIPALAVSTLDADRLSDWLTRDPDLSVKIVSTCTILPDAKSFNVIGEIRGTTKPGEYITAGGHLDAWDTGEGAHDDGGGCIQTIEMIRLFKKTGIKPKRTIRAVMFMNEEISGTGGKAYAAEAKRNGEIHYAALESDRGVMSPRGFSFDADSARLKNLQSLSKYFAPFNIRDFDRGGGGSDISPLKAIGALQIGYIPDPQRYFWFHHSGNDTLEQVNERELQLGSAAITSLVYLLDLFDL